MTAPNDTGEHTRRPLRDGIDTVRIQATEVASSAREAASHALYQAKDSVSHAREAVSDAYASSRERAADAYATARETAKAKAEAARKSAGEGIDTSPLVVLAGGIAIGAALGALLPRTKTEAKALGAVGERINGVAKEAAAAAKDAGKEKLAELGLTPDKARDTMKSLIDGAITAATTAGTAAADKAKAKAVKKN